MTSLTARTTAQGLLEAWRTEVARKPLGMTEAEACEVLDISPGPKVHAHACRPTHPPQCVQ